VKEVIYKTVDGFELRADVFEPEDQEGGIPCPTIVFFHGGGWSGGTPAQFHEHCQHLSSRGMLAISAQYRLLGSTASSPFDCVADGKSAIRWVRLHAAELGVDPRRLAAGGGSAGGHVAACAGVIEGLDEGDEDQAISSRPDCLVLFNPVIDTTPSGWQKGAELLGEQAQQLSPAHHVVPGAPPCLIFHGTGDTTVPFENAARFEQLMAEAGNTCELVAFEGQSHGFFNFDRDGGICYEQTLQATDAFLVQRGFLAEMPA